MMENLDNQIGGLLDMLVGLGVDESTIVFFASDNGAHHEGGHDPEFWDSNGPLRGIKRDVYEGGIRTPFLARWPGKIKTGTTGDHISAFWDILPTMAELTGQPVPAQCDGISLVPTLLGNPGQKTHKYIYHEFIQGAVRPYSSRSLRLGDWKAVQTRGKGKNGELNRIELYNLKDDLGETTNLAAENPEVVGKMERYMDEAHTPLK